MPIILLFIARILIIFYFILIDCRLNLRSETKSITQLGKEPHKLVFTFVIFLQSKYYTLLDK